MTPDRSRQIEDLYNLALDRGESALADVDPELRREVQKRLAQNSGTEIIAGPAFEPIADNTKTYVTAGSQIGPYKIEALLGQGGMGQVFRALDTRLGRSVAIKVGQARFSDRFEREARAIAALSHPNICTLYDVGANYLVMEMVEGDTLAGILKRGRLSIEQTIQYGTQIAGALAAAHAKGIVHRDLKPGNIMIAKAGVKVLDFGLARSTQDKTVTAANAVMGTPAYMAPEQQEGKPCDARADIYSFGLVLAEMAIGQRLQPGAQTQLDLLPEKLAHVVERCLAPDREDRWQSSQDVKSELEWAARSAAAPVRTRPTGRRSFVWPAIACLALAGFAAIALVHFREVAPELPLRYANIVPPENNTFGANANLGLASLSPDGRYVAFAATNENGERQLWLRPLDKAQAQPLQNTGSGRLPFWSPDSRWVGFFAEGRLKKIDTLGGPPVTLADAPVGYGGSWSANGMIVFAPNSFAPLLKISSNGGSTSLAAEMSAATGTAHGFPFFLPDGEHFLFTSWGGSGRLSLRLGSLHSTASVAIGEADSNAVYSQGRLLYLSGNSLMAEPFDVKSLRRLGGALRVAEGVKRSSDLVAMGAFSASQTGLLAYQTGVHGPERKLTWFDRLGKPMGTLGQAQAFFDIEFSPDRKTLAASVPDSSGNYDLWTYDIARGLPTRFTSDPAGEYYAAWSSDGRTVIFNSTRKGHYDLYRKSANGAGTEELLYADELDKVPMSWSRDGNFLLYYTGGGSRKQLWVLPLTPERPGAALKSRPFRQSQFNESFGQFSPDGQWVLYESDESQRPEVYVAPFSRPTEQHRISPNGGYRPRWRQDGKEIFYAGLDGRLMAAAVRMGGETVEIDGVHALFPGIRLDGGYGYDVSADGQHFLAAVPAGNQKSNDPITLVQNWMAALKR